MNVICNKSDICSKKDCLHFVKHHHSGPTEDDVGCSDGVCSEHSGASCEPVGMITYIAGAMSGHKNFNFDKFDKVRDYLKAAGHHPISPADIDRLFEGWDKYPPEGFSPTIEDCARYMRRDLNAIEGADAVYMMEGWAGSKDEFDQLMKLMDNFSGSSGALVEFAFARFLKKQILLEIEGM